MTKYRLTTVQERKDAGPTGPTVDLAGVAAGEALVFGTDGNMQTRADPSGTVTVDGTNGSDTDPTRNGYATITAALAAASSGDVVSVAPGAYTESVSVPAGVHLWAPGVVLTGAGSPNITVSTGSRVTLGELVVPNSQIGVLQATASADAYCAITEITLGSSCFGFINTGANGILCAIGATIWVGASSFAFGDATTNDGHIDIDYSNIYATGAGATGLAAIANGKIVGKVGHLVEVGGTLTGISAAGGTVELVTAEIEATTGITIASGGVVRCVTGELEGSTASYTVASGGSLYLVAAQIVGAATNSGTAKVTIAGDSVYQADLSTAWDATAAPTGPDGWTGSGALGDYTTLGFAGGAFVATLAAPGADKAVVLSRTLTGYQDLYLQPHWMASVVATLTTMSLTSGNLWFVSLEDSAGNEISKWGQQTDGANRRLWHLSNVNAGGPSSQYANDASYNSAGNRHFLWLSPAGQMNSRLKADNTVLANTTIAAAPHIRPGAGAPVLKIGVTCKSGGSMALSIASIQIAGLV
jgi:hypothetical protein